MASMHEGLARRRADTERRCLDAAQCVGSKILFGMTTGLELRGVPIPRECDLDRTKLHTVASVHARRVESVPLGLQAHVWKHFGTGDYDMLNPHVGVLSLFHIWAQMASHVPLESLIALGDAVIASEARRTGREPAQVLAEFTMFVRNLPQCRGKRRCRKALRFVRTHVDSLQETDCRITFERHGIPCPETGYVVPGFFFKSGAKMTLDMAWAEYKVAVEHDGDHHRTDQAQWRRDKEKRDRLRAHGWIIITVTAANLASDQARAELAFEVARALALRGARFTFHVVALSLDEL